jgi:hypothetical protein
VELENLALRHQLHVLRRQRPGWHRLLAIDRLLLGLALTIVAALCGEDCGVGVVVEPASLLDGDSGRGVGEPDAHAPDCEAGLPQKPDHGYRGRSAFLCGQ